MSKNKDQKGLAQKLYCQYDTDGKKTYSLRDIQKKLKENFTKGASYRTVKNWSEAPDKTTGETWNDLNEKIKRTTIEKTLSEKFSDSEKIVEAQSDATAKDYKNADNLANVGLNIIMDAYKDPATRKNISIRDALAAIKTGTEIKFRIADIPDSEKEKKTQVIKIGDQYIEF